MEHDGIMKKLSRELLEQVAGGMTADQEQHVRASMLSVKEHGLDQEFALRVMDTVEDEALRQEYKDYIIQNWDLI